MSLFQVVANLVDVCKCVQVLVLVQHLIRLFLVVAIAVVHQDDLALAVLVDLLELKVLVSLVLDRLDEFALHGRLAWQVADATIVFLIVLCILMQLII